MFAGTPGHRASSEGLGKVKLLKSNMFRFAQRQDRRRLPRAGNTELPPKDSAKLNSQNQTCFALHKGRTDDICRERGTQSFLRRTRQS